MNWELCPEITYSLELIEYKMISELITQNQSQQEVLSVQLPNLSTENLDNKCNKNILRLLEFLVPTLDLQWMDSFTQQEQLIICYRMEKTTWTGH